MRTKLLYFITAGLFVSLLFSVGQCQSKKTAVDHYNHSLNDTIRYYTNALGSKTATITTLQISQGKLNKVILKKDRELAALSKSFNRVDYITKYKTITAYDTITLVFHDTIPYNFTRTGSATTKWYRFNYIANQNGIKLDSLTFPNTATVITGTKRNWFLGRETLVTEVTNTNPYIMVTEIKAAEVPLPTPVYKKWYVWLGMGIAGGYLLTR